MKLLTLNTHSLIEPNYAEKLRGFVNYITIEQPDVIALQEVNQTSTVSVVKNDALRGYHACSRDTVIREDNHVLCAARMLYERGIDYHWTWLAIKKGYGRYDEGIALMSRSSMIDLDSHLVTRTSDYNDWKTRRVIGIRTSAQPKDWFYSVHFGWWSDPTEPFAQQWRRMVFHLAQKESVWLMGDFNNPACVRGEGYDMIRKDGWNDCYLSAEKRDSGITVNKSIDGWNENSKGLRIDQIWSRQKNRIKSARVIFDGTVGPVVSDHYGLMIEYERSNPQ